MMDSIRTVSFRSLAMRGRAVWGSSRSCSFFGSSEARLLILNDRAASVNPRQISGVIPQCLDGAGRQYKQLNWASAGKAASRWVPKT
jgi:hypothetical protein